MRRAGDAALTLAALAVVAGQQVQAQACAAPALVQAAQLVEFETLMMTVSLRCARAGVDLQPAYEGMVTAHAARFFAAQALVGQRLGDSHGAGYDRYVTAVANRYGGGTTDPAHCAMFRTVAVSLGQARDDSKLDMVAAAMIRAPLFRDGSC